MKQLLLILVLIPSFIFAQKTFAPLGATWHYEGGSEWNGAILDCEGNNIRYVVEAEVDIDGKDCSIIRSYQSTNIDTTWRSRDSLVVWEDEKKIYFQQDSSFLLMFDFGADVGDSIIRYDPFNRSTFSGTFYDDTATTANRMELLVAEVDSIEIQGIFKRIQYLVPIDPISDYSDDQVIESIGSSSQTICGTYYFHVANGCDGSGFRCYEDAIISHPVQGCDFLDSVSERLEDRIDIFPNPFTNSIQLETELVDFNLKLFDFNGRLIMQHKNKSQVNTQDLHAGIYFLQFSKDEKHFTTKVIKL